jgi:hypothetical protein
LLDAFFFSTTLLSCARNIIGDVNSARLIDILGTLLQISDYFRNQKLSEGWDQPLYPSSLALAKAVLASMVIPRALSANPLLFQAARHHWD